MTVVPDLIQSLAYPDDSVRAYIAEALGKLGDNTAVPGLIKVLIDSDNLWMVRCFAAEALGKIGHNSAVPGLIRALSDELWPVRSASAEASG